MADRTGTYNSTNLGDYLIPIKIEDLDIADGLEWGVQIKPIFESSTPSTRYSGPILHRKIVRFAKDHLVSGAGYDTDQELNKYFDSLRASFTTLIGSKDGASLVITDGVNSQTYAGAKITRLEKVRNYRGKAVFEAEFICPTQGT